MSRDRQTKYVDRVWALSQHSATEKFTLLAIAEHTNEHGVARPSLDRLAQLLGVGERYVTTLIAALEKGGELHTHRRKGKFNVYIIAVGMSEEEFAVAKTYVETVYPQRSESPQTTDPVITSTHDPLITSLFAHANEIATEQGIRGRNETTEQEISGWNETTDPLITRTKDSVVVVQEDDPPPEQQQRDPTPAERALFSAKNIPEPVWRGWMSAAEPEQVIACLLHATGARNVTNPIGLARAMLEKGQGTPAPKYLQEARRKIGMQHDRLAALEAAGWDPREVGGCDDA